MTPRWARRKRVSRLVTFTEWGRADARARIVSAARDHIGAYVSQVGARLTPDGLLAGTPSRDEIAHAQLTKLVATYRDASPRTEHL